MQYITTINYIYIYILISVTYYIISQCIKLEHNQEIAVHKLPENVFLLLP